VRGSIAHNLIVIFGFLTGLCLGGADAFLMQWITVEASC